MKLAGQTALITGAASGIGRALALGLAAKGCHLALADIDASGLDETSALLGKAEIRLSSHVLDVRDQAATAALPTQLQELHGGIGLLINNAGVAMGGTFDMVSAEAFDWLMDINFHAVVRFTRAFLPQLQAKPEARIVNVCPRARRGHPRADC